MMTQEQIERFMRLRRKVFAFVAVSTRIDSHHKDYEGEMHIVTPGCFQEKWKIILLCYLLGSGREHVWEGDTFDEALTKAEHGILGIVCDEYDNILDWCAQN